MCDSGIDLIIYTHYKRIMQKYLNIILLYTIFLSVKENLLR